MTTIHVQLAITLDDEAAIAVAEVLTPAIKQTIGPSTDAFDQRRSADRRTEFGPWER